MKYLLVTLSPSLPPRSRKQQHPPSNSSSSCCSQDSLHPTSERASEQKRGEIQSNPHQPTPPPSLLASTCQKASSLLFDSTRLATRAVCQIRGRVRINSASTSHRVRFCCRSFFVSPLRLWLDWIEMGACVSKVCCCRTPRHGVTSDNAGDGSCYYYYYCTNALSRSSASAVSAFLFSSWCPVCLSTRSSVGSTISCSNPTPSEYERLLISAAVVWFRIVMFRRSAD
jgi:hypothetical protein